MDLDRVSKEVYEQQISPLLPEKIVDIHVHIGLPEHVRTISPERKAQMWAMEIANSFSWEELRSITSLLFPDKSVESLTFGFPYQEINLDANNKYVLEGAKDSENSAFALALTHPNDSDQKLEHLLSSGFIGIKPYPDMAPGGYGEVSIYDFLPDNHLSILDSVHGILMLHLPRKNRLADPDNIRELLEIYEKYPQIKIIVAHVGRAYCLPTASAGLPSLKGADRLYYDFAANLNPDVIEYAIETVGAERILYGSDLPITLMKGVREHVGESYFNFTDGPYSWNTNRKPAEVEANYTYFLYEELLALIKAAGKLANSAEIISQITCTNAQNLIASASK